MRTELAGLVDLDRYPIDRLDSPAGQELVAQAQAELAATGVCQLPGFLFPAAVEATLLAAEQLHDLGWHSDNVHNVWFDPIPEDPAPGDPRAMLQHSSKRAIAYDLLPAELPLRRLYESDELTELLRRVLGVEVLYRSVDPLDALEIAVFEPGDELGWHFDNSEFSVTIMLREAGQGGHFDVVPRLRSVNDANDEGVTRFLEAGGPFDRLPTASGTLAVFRGHHALHRVSPVTAGPARINAVLTYGDRPDMRLTPLTQQLFYGRVVGA